jgi:hypothetical protein
MGSPAGSTRDNGRVDNGRVDKDASVDKEASVTESDSRSRRKRRIVPGGIVANKRSLARNGGFMGLAVAGATATVGGLILLTTSGSLLGVVGFVLVTCGAPLLSLVGIPAVSSTTRWAIAIVGSAALWWWVGQLSAARVRKRAVAGWKEWWKEFGLYAVAIWIGALSALAVAAKVLGAV